MRFAIGLTGLIVALPSVLAAALPAANGLALSGDIAVAQRRAENSTSGLHVARSLKHISQFEIDWICKRSLYDKVKGLHGADHGEDEDVTDDDRGAWTQYVVEDAANTYRSSNWLIVRANNVETRWDENTEWVRFDVELPRQFGGGFMWWDYTIYGFESGTIERTGDGGYLNWAYNGNVTLEDGALVTFAKRG